MDRPSWASESPQLLGARVQIGSDQRAGLYIVYELKQVVQPEPTNPLRDFHYVREFIALRNNLGGELVFFCHFVAGKKDLKLKPSPFELYAASCLF